MGIHNLGGFSRCQNCIETIITKIQTITKPQESRSDVQMNLESDKARLKINNYNPRKNITNLDG
jgi:hypothetical protein